MSPANDIRPPEDCGSCMCWRRFINEDIGDCRLKPPVISEAMISLTLRINDSGRPLSCLDEHDLHQASNYPVTHEDDWCREYTPKLED